MAFVTAAANLRAHIYHIPEKTRFEAKQIAGNIIPAIATTNAIVSGLVVVQALHILAQRWDETRIVSIARRPTRMFTTFPTGAPNPACDVCHDVYVGLAADPMRARLGDVLDAVRRPRDDGGLGIGTEMDFSIADGARILYDADLEDNVGKTLGQIGIRVGSTLSLTDEDGEYATVQLMLLPTEGSEQVLKLPEHPPALRKRPAVKVEPEDSSSDDDIAVVQTPVPQKRAADDADAATQVSKKRAADSEDAGASGASPGAKKARVGASMDAAIVLD